MRDSGGLGNVDESAFSRQKGVVNGLAGPKNTRVKPTERKTGVASFGSCGGRSFIKTDKSSQKKPLAAASSSSSSSSSSSMEKPRRAATVNQLGAVTSSGTNMSDREKRAAYFAQKFGK